MIKKTLIVLAVLLVSTLGIPPERLLDHYPALMVQPCGCQTLDHVVEQIRRDRQERNRAPAIAQAITDPLECRRVAIVAVDIGEIGQ
jgi:hypothetical protein